MKRIKYFFKGVYNAFCGEFKLFLHDPGIILFITFLPLVYPVIYSLIYNPELVKEVPMVVVDHDRTVMSRKVVREIGACDEARIIGYAADMGEARRALDSHKCFAILEIPEGFGRKIGRLETANAVMYSDMTLLLRYRGFLVATTNVMTNLGAQLLEEDINRVAPLAGTLTDGELIRIEDVSMGNIRNGFDSFIMPGVLILILHQCIVLTLGMSGGARREKYLRGSYTSTESLRFPFRNMTGQALCLFTVLFIPSIYLIHYVPLMFRFPMAGSLLQEIVFLVPMAFACFGIGFLFQAFVSERESVFLSWVVTSLIFLLLSGLIWPRYDMPGFWKFLSDLCPSTWAVEGFVKMNGNGATLGQVSHEYIMLWILAAGYCIAGYCAQKWYVGPAVRRQVRVAEISE